MFTSEGSCRKNETHLDSTAYSPSSPLIFLSSCALRYNYLFLWLLNFTVSIMKTALQHRRKVFYNINPKVFIYALVSRRRIYVGREQYFRIKDFKIDEIDERLHRR